MGVPITFDVPKFITTTVQKTEGSTSTHSTVTYKTSKTQDTVAHTLTDDGAGGFGPYGTINYAGKSLNVRLVSLNAKTEGYKSDHDDASEFESTTAITGGTPSGSSIASTAKGGEYGDTAVSEEILAASTVSVTYAVGFASPETQVMTFRPPTVTIDLCPYTSDYIVPGSVLFTWMGHTYQDVDGVIYRDRTGIDAGFVAGQLDYSSGIAEIYDYVVVGSPTDFTLNSLWTVRQNWTTGSIFFRTQSAPIKPGGLVLSLVDAHGDAMQATAGLDGVFEGDHMRGRMDHESGVGELQFGDYVLAASLTDAEKAEWWYNPADIGAVTPGMVWRPWPVDPTTLRFNSVTFTYLPLDAEILGLDPVRLPPDGRVPIYRVGTYVVVGHTGRIPAATYTAGTVVDCARERLSRAYLVDATGALIHTGYTLNLNAGTVTVVDPTGWVQPVVIKHRIEEMARLSDVGIDGTLKLTKRLSHVFPIGSYVSSAIMCGNLRARALPVFDQGSWDGVTWADATVGAPASASYNDGAFSIAVTNAGAFNQRFGLRVLTGGTEVEVIGEKVGNLGNFSRNTDIAPINPASGAPYFTLRAAGWGAGWAPGNTLFLPTVGSYYPLAAIRTIQPGEATVIDDAFEILGRGDVDRAPTSPVI